MRDRVAGDSVYAGCVVHLLDAVSLTQRARRDLSGSGLFADGGGSKGELASGANAEHAADDALLAHTDAHHRPVVAGVFQELHHGYVVVKARRSANDLDEVRRILLHPLESLLKVFGAAKIVIRKNEPGLRPQLLHFARLQLGRGLERQVHNLATGSRSLY